jgi:hypothetical protein
MSLHGHGPRGGKKRAKRFHLIKDEQTKEHDFLVDREEWELNVFDAAIKEGNFASINIKTKQRIEYPNFPAAMKALHKVSGQHMLYAVAKSGRFVMLPPRKWNDFARRYLAARAVGQVQG